MKEPSTEPLKAVEADIYKLFDMVWSKYSGQIKSGQIEDKMTEVEYFILDRGPAWLQDIGYSRGKIADAEHDNDFCFQHNEEQPCKYCAKKKEQKPEATADQLPPRERFKRMKDNLRGWINKNHVEHIKASFYTGPTGERGVTFKNEDDPDAWAWTIIGWPRIGLTDGAIYTPDELLLTGAAGE